MADVPVAPRFLENLGVFLTYRCQVACAHCLVRAGPNRTEAIDEREALDWIAQAASYDGGRIKAINFTGGEPFLDVPKLRRLVCHAASRRLVSTAVTNAHWATSPAAAIEVLKGIPELPFLQISADEHHQAAIPIERVLNAIEAAKELGLLYGVAVCTEREDAPGYQRILEQLATVTDSTHIRTVRVVPVDGKKPGLRGAGPGQAGDLPRAACGGAVTPVVLPDGRVLPCFGSVLTLRGDHPLLLGNLREQSLSEILDRAQENVALHCIRVWGPARLHERLCAAGLGAELPDAFGTDDICGLCAFLMSRPGMRDRVRALSDDREFVNLVAYARAHFFDEDELVRARGLEGA